MNNCYNRTCPNPEKEASLIGPDRNAYCASCAHIPFTKRRKAKNHPQIHKQKLSPVIQASQF